MKMFEEEINDAVSYFMDNKMEFSLYDITKYIRGLGISVKHHEIKPDILKEVNYRIAQFGKYEVETVSNGDAEYRLFSPVDFKCEYVPFKNRLTIPKAFVDKLNNKTGFVKVKTYNDDRHIYVENCDATFTNEEDAYSMTRKFFIDKYGNVRLSKYVIKNAFKDIEFDDTLVCSFEKDKICISC